MDNRAEIYPKGEFSAEEKKAIELSGELWNSFVALPIQHPSDRTDFCNAIHTIQRILGWRPMVREGHYLLDRGVQLP